MAGYFWLGLIQSFNKITDADLAVPHQVQETQTCIVAEGLEEAFHAECFLLAARSLFRAHGLNYICIDEYMQRGI